MKIAIITMSYGINYGNRLQNYALQELIKSLGFDVETIRFSKRKKGFLNFFIYYLKNVIKFFIGYRLHYAQKIRLKRFENFNQKYIKWGLFSFLLDYASPVLINRYDYFVVGSDQVWNAFFGDISKNIHLFLESFVSSEKRIAYAASFGTSNIRNDFLDLFQFELPKFKAISVREKDGVKLTNQCGANATLVLDPTMMLDSKQWNLIAKKPAFIMKNSFIVTYFLGGRNSTLNDYVRSFAKGRDVINLESESIPKDCVENLQAFTTSPDEFVWLIAHADAVLTDSFHATAFSILYHKPFLVFDRIIDSKVSGMENRIDTLLGLLGLECCKGNMNALDNIPIVSDWNNVDNLLLKEKLHSIFFLKDALKM